MSDILKQFQQAIIQGDGDRSAEMAEAIIAEGKATPDEIFDFLAEAMEVVGSRYETGEYFIPEMLRSAESVEKAMGILEPYLFERRHDQTGIIVMGTVKGDIHNIGKNIIVSALRASGYEVHDLGVNISTDKFINKVREVNADMLMLSAFTTSTKSALIDIMESLEREGMRDHVKVVSGGASHSVEFARAVGVDGFAKDVKSTLAVCRRLMGEQS
ncbi:MAG: cobalamin-dependent protein [Thermoleophilia bacterium]